MKVRKGKKTKMVLTKNTSTHTMKVSGKSYNRNFHGIRHLKSIRKDSIYGAGLMLMEMVYYHWLRLTKLCEIF